MSPSDADLGSRHYPSRPIVGVGAVVLTSDERIVLVRRRHEPLLGRWSLPGGAVETGETLEQAIVREVQEETGFEVKVGPRLCVIDRIHRDDEGRVAYHYVLIDFLCWPIGGQLRAGSDATDLAVAGADDLTEYALEQDTVKVIDAAVALSRRRARGESGEPALE